MRDRRRTGALDRTVLVVVALVLIAFGVALLAVTTAWLPEVTDRWRTRLDADAIDSATGSAWWPFATAIAGLLLVGLGVWWLLAHLPGRRVRDLRLAGSTLTGRLEIDPAAVARAAGREATASPHVRSARLALVRERGGTVLTGTVRTGPHVPLERVAGDLDELTRQSAHVLGDDTLTGRIHLAVGRRDGHGRTHEPR